MFRHDYFTDTLQLNGQYQHEQLRGDVFELITIEHLEADLRLVYGKILSLL